MSEVDGTAFILCALAVWRITHLVALEDGPFDLVFTFRKKVGDNVVGSLLDCFLCLSLWVAAPFAVLVSDTWVGRLVGWLALSGAASSLYMVTDRPSTKEGKSQ